MADRSVKVRLSARVQEYIAGMEQAAQKTRETGSEAEKLTQQREAFNQLGVAALGMGTLAAAGVTLAVSKWADFDAAMSNVQAATMESEENMKLLSDAALDAGARTVFSAEEAANAIEELAKAGVSTADILNGALDGALDLAAAGGLGVAEAAGIAATALKTFNLEGRDMSHVADLLAAGAGKAMGDVTDLSAALNQSAMVANATGLSIEETTAALSAFASQGLLGSDAGTSFKSMLQSLTPTSAAARDTMQELGITAYDAQGNFIGLTEFAGNLQNGLKDLSVEQQQAALKTIFGSDAIRAATVLYSEGAEGIQEWINAVNDQGYAAEQAAARLDNLKGDLEALGGALDTALIKTGSGANDVLRGMVQWLTDAVDAYNDLPAPLQGAALGIGIVTAGVGLLGGAMLISVTKIAEFKIALATLGVTGTGARTALMGLTRFLGGPWGIAMGLAAISVATLTKIIEDGRAPVTEIGNALRTSADAAIALKKASETSDFEAFWMGDAAAALKDLPGLMDTAREHGTGFFSFLENQEYAALGTLNRFNQALAEVATVDFGKAQTQFANLAESQNLNREQMLTLLDVMPDYRDEVIRQANEMGISTDSAKFLALALGEIGPAADTATDSAAANAEELTRLQDEAESAADEVKGLEDAIRNFGSAQFDVQEATIGFHAAVADLEEQLASGQSSLDVTTEAGRNTHSAMLDVAASTNEYAASLSATGATTDEIAGALEAGRQRIIDTRMALGDSREAAIAYADSLIATPDTVPTQVQLNGVDEAERKLAFVTRVRDALIRVRTEGGAGSGALNFNPFASANGNLFAYANGGMNDYSAQMAAFANGGGVETGIYRGGTPIYKFAEQETGWEALISGKAGQEARNRQIWVETGRRLGMNPGGESVVQQVPVELVVKDVDGALIGRMRVEASSTVAGALSPLGSGPIRDKFGVGR